MTLTFDQIRSTQTPADAINGSIVAGYSIEGVKDASGFTRLHDFANEKGFSLFFCGGDAENTTDEHLVSLYPWLLGKEVLRVEGGYEQARGLEYRAGGALDKAQAEVGACADEVATFCSTHSLSTSRSGTYLLARGGLALALLLKGEWINAPDEAADDPEELDAWLATHGEPLASPTSGVVGFRNGTRGSSQEPFPGVVRGICIAGADATAERFELSPTKEAELDARLSDAGITTPRYFLITRYD
jgi:hypothetical protein